MPKITIDGREVEVDAGATILDHVLRDRRLRDVVPEEREFVFDARRAPGDVLDRHAPDEMDHPIGIGGRPGLDRDLRRQKCRKPLRCHLMTVAGCTITRASRQSRSIRMTDSQKIRSRSVMCWNAVNTR